MFRFAQEKKNDFTKDLPLKERQKLNSLFKSNAFSFRESVFPVGSIIVMPVSGKKYQVQASGEWVRVYDENTPPRNNKKQRRLEKVLSDIEKVIEESSEALKKAIKTKVDN